MKRPLKWLPPVLVLCELGLVWFDVLNLGDAVLILVTVEALLLVVGGHLLLSAIAQYRRGRSSGLDVWTALEDGLTVFMPRPVARITASEPRLFYCLIKWAFRRTGLREGEFSYHKRSTRPHGFNAETSSSAYAGRLSPFYKAGKHGPSGSRRAGTDAEGVKGADVRGGG